MNMAVKNYAVIQLPVSNLEASIHWYHNVLDIPFTFPFTPGDTEAWLNVGGIGLGLVSSPNVPKLEFENMHGVVQPIISLQVDDIHQIHSKLRERGLEVGEMSYKQGGGYSFILRDPDGHVSNLWGGWPKEGGEAPADAEGEAAKA
ncbi:VOC family protein [Paenibacillus sp. RUD330]|nr:VOC family protein [Paenibacillus sp. RUD330]